MDDDKIWHIHGARYDLSAFLSEHPGGRNILLASRGIRDATPLFESYHAFANRTYIRSKLAEFQIHGPAQKPLYSFAPTGFYSVVTQRAREAFGARGNAQSVTKQIKATKAWYAKVLLQFLVFALGWIAFFILPSGTQDLRPALQFALGFALGMLFISLGFNTMHDASHFAIRNRNHWINEFACRTWTAWALWTCQFWMTHHVVRHHSFTGHLELDPDVHHAKPFLRKSPAISSTKYLRMPGFIQRHVSIFIALVFCALPGMYLGQVLSYLLLWKARGHLWKMARPARTAFAFTWWELALSAASAASHFVQGPSTTYMISLGYLLGCNVAYAICILPDHDTVECAVHNHVTANEGGNGDAQGDWGEIQVRHSSDFFSNPFAKQCFGAVSGGINYQIAHHLFPSVSHMHFVKLDLIVEETCREFGLEKVCHTDLFSALASVAETFEITTNFEHQDKLAG